MKINNFKSQVKKNFSKLDKKKRELHIKINTDISRFENWIEQVDEIKPVKNSIVLSSGCGSAGDLYYFIKKKAKKVYGVETSPDLAKLAKIRLSIFNSNKYQIDTYDGNKLPYQDNKFDIIFSMHVIEHTLNPYLYLDELIRVTNKKGVIYLELPNKFYPKEQHTNLLFVHWLTNKIYKLLVKFKIAKKGYDLENFLSPIDIYKYINCNNKVKIKQSILHSYDNDNNNFDYPTFSPQKIYKLITKTSYKIVVEKNNS